MPASSDTSWWNFWHWIHHLNLYTGFIILDFQQSPEIGPMDQGRNIALLLLLTCFWCQMCPATNKYILLDGLTYNTRGYFASCVVFFRAPQGRGKMRAMSKMSASIINYVKPSNKRFIIPLQKGVILIQFYVVRVFFKKCIICPSGRLWTM